MLNNSNNSDVNIEDKNTANNNSNNGRSSSNTLPATTDLAKYVYLTNR